MLENIKPFGSVASHLHTGHLSAVFAFLRKNKIVEEALHQASDRGININDILAIIIPAAIDFALKKPVDVAAIVKALNALWNKPPEVPAPAPQLPEAPAATTTTPAPTVPAGAVPQKK